MGQGRNYYLGDHQPHSTRPDVSKPFRATLSRMVRHMRGCLLPALVAEHDVGDQDSLLNHVTSQLKAIQRHQPHLNDLMSRAAHETHISGINEWESVQQQWIQGLNYIQSEEATGANGSEFTFQLTEQLRLQAQSSHDLLVALISEVCDLCVAIINHHFGPQSPWLERDSCEQDNGNRAIERDSEGAE